MEYITDSIQIILNSQYAFSNNYPANSNMLFNINNMLNKDNSTLYCQASITSAQIPISYFIINSTNNYLSTSLGNFNLTLGNFDANSFQVLLLSLFPTGMIITISDITGAYTLTYTSNFTIYSTSTCQYVIGLNNNTNYTSISNILVFPYPCNFLGTTLIKIKSNTIQTKNMDSLTSSQNNVLGTVPVNNALGGLINYINYGQFKNIISNTSMDSVDIYITDQNNNLLNFNGVNVVIILQLDCIRQISLINTNLHSILSNTTEDPNLLNNFR